MLARLRKMTEEKEEGFTLIELLVVMIIIGILAAIAIPVFLNQQKKGYDASVKSDLRTVANELQTYYTDNQTYVPTSGFGSTAGAVTITMGTSALTGSGQYIGPDTISLSKNTTVTYMKGGSNGFCLKGTNSSGTNTYYYDSLAGGLQSSSGSTCTGSGY